MIRGLYTLTLITLLLSVPVFALDKDSVEGASTEKEKLDLPKNGVLASFGTSKGYGAAAAMPFGDLDLNEDKPSALSGSLSKQGKANLQVNLKNNLDDRGFSLSLQLVQFNESGAQIKADSFAASLSANGSDSRSVPLAYGMTSAELRLSSWREN